VIAVVALSPALDVTHHVDGVDWAGVNRPAAVRAVAGGKALNVARTLRALGADALLLGVAGGPTGTAVRAGLEAADVPAEFTEIAADTRRTFVVVDTRGGDVASFYEPAAPVTAAEFGRFLTVYRAALPGCAAVVLSGSLPPGLPAGTYGDLTAIATAAGVPVLLDTSGPALLHGTAAGPAIVKPNLAELAAATGRPLRWPSGPDPDLESDLDPGPGKPDRAAVLAAASWLRGQGAHAIVVSLGAAGLLAVTADGAWHAAPDPVHGNPTGAGDAAVAGLAHGLTLGQPWPERLRHAAALGAATAAAAIAGEFAAGDYQRAAASLRVRPLEPV
jgi:1-phosphofructokinase family hexose kinase